MALPLKLKEKRVKLLKNKIAGLLLAAGFSKRFGSDKIVHRLNDGESIGVQSAKNLQPFVDELKIVLPHRNSLREELFHSSNFSTVKNESHQSLLTYSLKTGLSLIQDADYCVVALADMPFVAQTTYFELTRIIDSNRFDLVAPSYRKQRGHPVAISSDVVRHFLNNDAKNTLKDYFNCSTFRHHIFSTDDSGVIFDIDYPDDLTRNRS